MALNTRKTGLCAAFSVALLAGAAQADDLLVVDLSVVNQVTINATNGLSAVNASGSDSTGVYFENFYGGPGGFLADALVSGDLTNAENPSDGTPDLFRGSSGGGDPGLNMWSWSSDSTVTFTARSRAFTGSATWTLSATEYAEMLAGNSSGNLYFAADTFDDIGSASLLGTYSVVVPAPGVISLAGLGLAGALRRRR
jgi:hypothetical protein